MKPNSLSLALSLLCGSSEDEADGSSDAFTASGTARSMELARSAAARAAKS